MRARGILQKAGALVGALGLSVTALGAVQLATATASHAAGVPMDYSPETSAGGPGAGYAAQSYMLNGSLSPSCPNALADTPGSGPASNAINTVLDSDTSTEPGGTIHYVFSDNGTGPFVLQVCQVAYPSGTFTSADFNPDGTFVAGANPSKSTLNGGTEIDGASLSGVPPGLASPHPVYYEWTFCNGAPGVPCSGTSIAGVAPGMWICQFARDINDKHSGGGNRKAAPVCFQVTAPHLQIGKTGPATANEGQTVTYTVKVSNNDPAGFTGVETQAVTMTDPTPAGLTFVSETNPGLPWTCVDPAVGPPAITTLTCTKPASTSPPTMTAPEIDKDTFTVKYTVDAGTAGTTLTNIANAQSSDGGNPQDKAKTDINAKNTDFNPGVAISKSATSTSVAAVGGTAEYTITVVTTDGQTAGVTTHAQATVTDTVPAGTWTIASQTFPAAHQCSFNGPPATVLTCTEPSLDAGTYSVTIDSSTSAVMCSSISNTAKVTSTNAGVTPVGGETTPAVISMTGCAPAVDLSKAADSASVALGSPVSFLISAFVTGAQPAANLVITDNLPANTGLWSINVAAGAIPVADSSFPTACTLAGALGTQVLTCNEASLSGTTAAHPGGTTYAVDVKADTNNASCSGVSNVASATLGGVALASSPTPSVSTGVTGCPVDGGPVPNNPTTTTTTTTLACPAPGIAGPGGTCVQGESLTPDPRINKTADAANVNDGQPIGFTITLTNPGNADTQATITDPLPTAAGLSWSIDKQPVNGPTCSIGNGTLTCGPANLAVGASWSVHIISPTTAQSCGIINNTASVSSPNLSSPRSAGASESVTCVLGVTVSAPTAVATPVQNLPFTGANTARLLSLGATSAMIGAILMLLGRRRPEDELVPVTAEDPLGRI
jgi:uncharacterized repeat protein (TIGR01451 family)